MNQPRPHNLPPHGSRRRYRHNGCRCVACTRGPLGVEIPDKLMWPFRWLDRKAHDQIGHWFTPEQVENWKLNGMGDYEADEACIKLGLMPHDVFPGYMEAGLDCEVYP